MSFKVAYSKKARYYEGTVVSYASIEDEAPHTVRYDDGDVFAHNLDEEPDTWEWIAKSAQPPSAEDESSAAPKKPRRTPGPRLVPVSAPALVPAPTLSTKKTAAPSKTKAVASSDPAPARAQRILPLPLAVEKTGLSWQLAVPETRDAYEGRARSRSTLERHLENVRSGGRPTAVGAESFVGLRVSVFWEGERKRFSGVAVNFDAAAREVDILYDDGDRRPYAIAEMPELILTGALLVHEYILDAATEENITSKVLSVLKIGETASSAELRERLNKLGALDHFAGWTGGKNTKKVSFREAQKLHVRQLQQLEAALSIAELQGCAVSRVRDAQFERPLDRYGVPLPCYTQGHATREADVLAGREAGGSAEVEAPMMSKAPKTIKEPVATQPPVASQSRLARHRRLAHHGPLADKVPLAVQVPVVRAIKAPTARKGPAASKAPAAAKAFAATRAPAATGAPAATRAPAATKASAVFRSASTVSSATDVPAVVVVEAISPAVPLDDGRIQSIETENEAESKPENEIGNNTGNDMEIEGDMAIGMEAAVVSEPPLRTHRCPNAAELSSIAAANPIPAHVVSNLGFVSNLESEPVSMKKAGVKVQLAGVEVGKSDVGMADADDAPQAQHRPTHVVVPTMAGDATAPLSATQIPAGSALLRVASQWTPRQGDALSSCSPTSLGLAAELVTHLRDAAPSPIPPLLPREQDEDPQAEVVDSLPVAHTSGAPAPPRPRSLPPPRPRAYRLKALSPSAAPPNAAPLPQPRSPLPPRPRSPLPPRPRSPSPPRPRSPPPPRPSAPSTYRLAALAPTGPRPRSPPPRRPRSPPPRLPRSPLLPRPSAPSPYRLAALAPAAPLPTAPTPTARRQSAPKPSARPLTAPTATVPLAIAPTATVPTATVPMPTEPMASAPTTTAPMPTAPTPKAPGPHMGAVDLADPSCCLLLRRECYGSRETMWLVSCQKSDSPQQWLNTGSLRKVYTAEMLERRLDAYRRCLRGIEDEQSTLAPQMATAWKAFCVSLIQVEAAIPASIRGWGVETQRGSMWAREARKLSQELNASRSGRTDLEVAASLLKRLQQGLAPRETTNDAYQKSLTGWMETVNAISGEEQSGAPIERRRAKPTKAKARRRAQQTPAVAAADAATASGLLDELVELIWGTPLPLT